MIVLLINVNLLNFALQDVILVSVQDQELLSHRPPVVVRRALLWLIGFLARSGTAIKFACGLIGLAGVLVLLAVLPILVSNDSVRRSSFKVLVKFAVVTIRATIMRKNHALSDLVLLTAKSPIGNLLPAPSPAVSVLSARHDLLLWHLPMVVFAAHTLSSSSLVFAQLVFQIVY
jgi:hypothetical protein